MRQSTINRMIDESRRIYRHLILNCAFLVVSIIFCIRPATRDNEAVFIMAVATAIISLVSIALNIVMVSNLNRRLNENGGNDDNEPPTPPPDVTFEWQAEQRAPDVRLEYAEDTTVRISRQRLTRRQWRTLANVLSEGNWRWTRAQVNRARVIKNLTAPGVYRTLTNDLEQMGIVEKGRVTINGREAICEAAGLSVVI